MTKYDAQVLEIQKYLPSAQNILITLPTSVGVDELAASLALFLSLEAQKKEVSIVTESPTRVGNSNLFGIGQVQNELPAGSSGNLTIILSGVVDPNTKIPPTLQELKYFPEGSDLHLVFYPLPGQKFEPTHITPRYELSAYDLIFTIGAATLNSLGSIYTNNQQVFANSKIVSIATSGANPQFGFVNIVDDQSSSLSEIVYQLLAPLNLQINNDIATNILTGIYAATSNLQSGNLSAVTFEIIAQSLNAGGVRPGAVNVTVQPQPQSMQSAGIFNSLFNAQPEMQGQSGTAESEPAPMSSSASMDNFSHAQEEEMPQEEQAVTPEEDWLTPKIYKGSSLS